MTARSSRQRGPSVPGRGSQMMARRKSSVPLLQKALADVKSICLLPAQPGLGLGHQAGEQSCFRRCVGRRPRCADPPSLPDSRCSFTFPSALSNQRDGAGWKPNQAPAAAKPLPSASSFTHQKLQQSPGNHSAWEALKIWLRTGTCISNSFPAGKAGGQAARS